MNKLSAETRGLLRTTLLLLLATAALALVALVTDSPSMMTIMAVAGVITAFVLLIALVCVAAEVTPPSDAVSERAKRAAKAERRASPHSFSSRMARFVDEFENPPAPRYRPSAEYLRAKATHEAEQAALAALVGKKITAIERPSIKECTVTVDSGEQLTVRCGERDHLLVGNTITRAERVGRRVEVETAEGTQLLARSVILSPQDARRVEAVHAA